MKSKCSVMIELTVEMRFEIFQHSECSESLNTHDRLKLAVTNGELFIFRIVEIAFIDDGPNSFDHFVPW